MTAPQIASVTPAIPSAFPAVSGTSLVSTLLRHSTPQRIGPSEIPLGGRLIGMTTTDRFTLTHKTCPFQNALTIGSSDLGNTLRYYLRHEQQKWQ